MRYLILQRQNLISFYCFLVETKDETTTQRNALSFYYYMKLYYTRIQYIGSLAVNFLNRQREPKQMSFCGFFLFVKNFRKYIGAVIVERNIFAPPCLFLKKQPTHFSRMVGNGNKIFTGKGHIQNENILDRHCPRLQ